MNDRLTAVQLLWIDDEISPSDPAVVFLQREGFHVDCAATGAAGLAMAQTARYDCILLDLRLHDIPGLAVLADLRTDKVETPVVVVTGFGDFESARRAARLGVAGFEVKPIFVDDLKVLVERVVGIVPPSSTRVDDGAPNHIGQAASKASLSLLLEVIHRLTQRSIQDAIPFDTVHSALASALSRALADRTTPMPAFLACADALRFTMACDRTDAASRIANRVQTLILDTLERQMPKDSRVLATLAVLESAVAQRTRVTLKEIAKTQQVDEAHLSRLISVETGFRFTQLRTAYLLRPSLAVLAETDEHVKQIACQLLGFSHQAHFDAEFHRFFRLSPSTFRRLVRSL